MTPQELPRDVEQASGGAGSAASEPGQRPEGPPLPPENAGCPNGLTFPLGVWQISEGKTDKASGGLFTAPGRARFPAGASENLEAILEAVSKRYLLSSPPERSSAGSWRPLPVSSCALTKGVWPLQCGWLCGAGAV